MDEDLPPLPAPYHGFYAAPMYSADQMRAYARAALRADERHANAASLLAGFDRLILAAKMAGDQSEVDAISATRARYCGLLAGAGIAAKGAA
jgi:hypothetical protein